MKKTYITLVSEQAIPNVQYIKEFASEIGTYLFVSTVEMEKKNSSQHIIDACGLKEGSYLVIRDANPESLSDILSKVDAALKKEEFSKTDGYIVNCTLGTKVMSIALYEYFRENEKALLLYTPIRTNKYKGLVNESTESTFQAKVTVEEYVKSYGIGIKNSSKPIFDSVYADLLMQAYLGFSDAEFQILEELREKYRNKGVKDILSVPALESFLLGISFKNKTANQLSTSEVRYLTGGWFEEWTYFCIKSRLNLTEGEIALGLNTLFEAENDLDVVFIFNNDIHIVECKTALGKELQQPTLYKSGALVDKFGRNAHSYLFTLSDLREPNGDIKTAIKDRAKQQKIDVLDKTSILSEIEEVFFKKIENNK